jgi:virginiamycin A acetyltransferase
MPSYAIIGGNPANVLKYRFTEATIKKLISLCWWNYQDECINLIVPLLQSVPCEETLAQIESLLLAFTPS